MKAKIVKTHCSIIFDAHANSFHSLYARSSAPSFITRKAYHEFGIRLQSEFFRK